MPNSLRLRTFLLITIADALDLFPGRSIGATGLPYPVSSSSAGIFSPLDGDGQGEGEHGKARLKLKMR
jgi:hypothetical protein